jgi:hypothetical protein
VLLAAILIVWSSITLLVLAVCAMAARGDGRGTKQRTSRQGQTVAPAETSAPIAAVDPGEHPLELLLEDRRKAGVAVTGRGGP